MLLAPVAVGKSIKIAAGRKAIPEQTLISNTDTPRIPCFAVNQDFILQSYL
jgi:hypothetical protein